MERSEGSQAAEEEANWRIKAIRERVEQHRNQERSDALVAAAKKSIMNKKRQLAIVKKYRDSVRKEEQATKRSIGKFSKGMEKFLDGADRQWMLDRSLRTMEISYRGSSEKLRDSRFLLSMAKRRINDIKLKIDKPIQATLTTLEKIENELEDDKNLGINNPEIKSLPPVPEEKEETLTVACKYCQKTILISKQKEHEQRCETASKDRVVVYSEEKDETTAEKMDTALPPQPPMHVRVLKTTCDSITFGWEKPIFDGGANIQGYEISWSLAHKKKVGKKIRMEYEPLPPIWTSVWCLEDPIAHNGYTVRNLKADTEFSKVSVRTLNRTGFSKPSSEIESVETALPLPPSQCLFLQVTEVSASTVSLSWAAPLFSGGSGGDESFTYEVQYTHIKQSAIEKGKEPGMVDVRDTITLDSPATSYVIKDLKGDESVRMIIVTAINSFGHRGPPSKEIMKVQTKPPRSSQVFRQELARAKKARGKFIESNLYQGFMQRFERSNFIEILEGKLKLAERDEANEDARIKAREDRLKAAVNEIEGPTIAEIEAKHREATGGNDDAAALNQVEKQPDPLAEFGEGSVDENEDEDDDDDIYEFATRKKKPVMDARARRKADKERARALLERKHQVRERQFTVRIKELNKIINDDIQQRANIIAQRAEVFHNIKLWAKRADEVQPELDRAMLFPGRFMDSDVMHHKPQRFLTTGLQKVLIGELEARLDDIAKGKEEMIQLENQANAVLEHQMKFEEKLKDRRAAYLSFQKEAEREKAAQAKLEEWSSSGLHDAFDAWKEYVHNRQGDRGIVGKFIRRFMNIELHGAFQHWKDVLRDLARILEESKAVEGGAGTQALEKTSQFRQNLEKETATVLDIVSKSQGLLDNSRRTVVQQRIYEEGKEFFKTYKAENEEEIEKSLTALELAGYNFGQSYSKSGDFEKALKHYLSFSYLMQEKGNLLMMARAWCGMGEVYTNMQLPEKAIVHFDRSIALSREARSTKTLADSYFGMGAAYEAQIQHRTALRFADRALRLYSMMQDLLNVARCYRLKSAIFKELNDADGIRLNDMMADKIELHGKQQRQKVFEGLTELQKRCSTSTADETDPFFIETCTACVPRVRREIRELQEKLRKLREEPDRITKDIKNAKDFQDHMRAQLIKADNSESIYMDSDSVHGAFQRFNVKELRKSLKEYIVQFDKKIAEMKKERRRAEIRCSNTQDDLNELFLELDTENGVIMKRALDKELMRACCLNPVNARGHDVLGGVTGGIEMFAFASGKRLNLHDMEGTCERIIEGDTKGQHIGEVSGHTKMVSSLCFYGNRLFSGSMDRTIMVWELGKHEHLAVIKGHNATVCAIDADAVKIVSGSADNEVRVWNAKTFELVATLTGHKRAPKCIHVGPTRFVTGGSDYEVRVWKIIEGRDNPFKHVSCELRMLGHGAAVTAIKLAVSEIVSGAANGTLMVWSITHGHSLWRTEAHESAILCLQFDAVKIITGSRDMTVKTFDISSGQCLQTLRGHRAPIVAIDFDHTLIMSVSNDGMIRRWPFRVHGKKATHEMKYHIIEPNQHIAQIASLYNTTAKLLRKWNNIKDLKKLYIGQRIIVQKQRVRKERLVCSPGKAAKDAALRKENKDISIEARFRSSNLSAAAQEEMANAGRGAVDALDDIKLRFATGSKVQQRIDELATITAAATGTTVAL